MWQVKMATKMASVSGHIPGMKKFSKYARWAGLSTAATLCVLGLLAIIIGIVKSGWLNVGIGVYALLLSGFYTILEVPYVPMSFLISIVNFFADYKFRIALFIIAAIPAFVSFITILGALMSIVTAGFYGFCLFKGESGEEIKSSGDQSSGKKRSLASQDTVV